MRIETIYRCLSHRLSHQCGALSQGFELGPGQRGVNTSTQAAVGGGDYSLAPNQVGEAADALGYGSCYIGDIIERCEQQREILGLPAYVMPVCMAVYGVPTEFQRERQKPARFDVRDIVFENEYQPRGAAEMRRMLEARQDKHGAELEQWITARCKRKWNCEFSEEMTRSAAKMIEMWREGK